LADVAAKVLKTDTDLNLTRESIVVGLCDGAVTSQHPAYNVTADAARSAVRLSWMPAYDAGFPLHYVVWYVILIIFRCAVPTRCVYFNAAVMPFVAYTVWSAKSGDKITDLDNFCTFKYERILYV